MSRIPILVRDHLDSILAWRPDGAVTVRQFLGDVALLKSQLPAGGHILNLCVDRYRFAVGFVAGLLSGNVSLQPASQSHETFERLRADYLDLICLCDGPADTLDLLRLDFPAFAEADRQAAAAGVSAIPAVPADQEAVILFTSG